MADKAEFYSQLYWDTQDSLRTTNNFKVSFLLVKDQYGTQVGRIQLTIQNYKNRERTSINFTFRELYCYIAKIKEKKTGPYSIKINGGKTFTTTYTKTMEYEQTVLLTISSRGEDILDSEKFYMPIQEFSAFAKLLCYIIESYPLITSTMNNYILLQGIGFEASQSNSTLNEIRRGQIQVVNNSSPVTVFESREERVVPEEETKNQKELGTFIEENLEDIDLGLSKDVTEKEEKKKKVNEKRVEEIQEDLTDVFTKDLINKDALKMENFLMGCVTSELPLYRLLVGLNSKLNNEDFLETFFPGCSQEEFNAAMYANTMYLKKYINKTLSDKSELPVAIYPMRMTVTSTTELNRNLMVSLYSYIVYYSIIHTQLKQRTTNPMVNRGFHLFALKVLFSPLVFSFLQSIEKETFVQLVSQRIKDYTTMGVFSKLNKRILDQFNYEPNINIDSVKTISEKTFDAINKKWDDIRVDLFTAKMEKDGILLCGIKNISEVKDLTTASRMVALEFNYKQNGKVVWNDLEFKDTDGMPEEYLEKLGLNKTQNSTNLIRFAKEHTEAGDGLLQDHVVSIVEKINDGYKDLEGEEVNYNEFPELVLRAIRLWDPAHDKKMTTNYAYFKKLVEESSLTKDVIVSILNGLGSEETEIEDFGDALDLNL